MNWWDSHDNRILLANWLHDNGELQSSTEMLLFFEKPWHWTDEFKTMQDELGRTKHGPN